MRIKAGRCLMDIRPIAILIGCFTAISLACGAAKEPPNIIMILADDLGYGDIGCYGQKRIQTPHIDRMSVEGMRFTQAYAGSPVCAPSRCVLMTGLHTGHCRVRGNGGARALSQVLRTEDVTIASVLKQTGYATAVIGKWGLGDVGHKEQGAPWNQGFDYSYGYLDQTHAHNYYPEYLWRNGEKVLLKNVVPNAKTNGAGVASQKIEYSADLIADEALAFIQRVRNQKFFLYYTPTLPHANNEAGKLGMEVPDHGPYADLDWPEPQKGHAAMITRLDRDVGRILALLKDLGLDDKTLVFFTSDNGPHREGGNDPDFNRSSGPLRGIKRALFDGGIRIPFIARWPGKIPAGATCDQVVWFPDFFPTAVEIAGAKSRTGIDGVSIVQTLKNPQKQIRRKAPFYWEFFEGGFKQAVLQDNWKLINQGAGKGLELYSLKNDLGETNNLAAQRPEKVRQLEKLMTKARVATLDWPTNTPAGLSRKADR